MPIASTRCHRYVDRLPALLGASLHFVLIGVINVKTGRATLIIDIQLPVLEFGYF